jgi:hypothetical protein
MTIQTFRKLLAAKHPEATATTTNERAGMTRGRYLAIAWTPGGTVYEYRGTLVGAAVRFGLIPAFDMEAEARRMRDELRRTGASEGPTGVFDSLRWILADDERERLVFPFRPTGRDEWGRDLTRCSLRPPLPPADPTLDALDDYLDEHGRRFDREAVASVALRHGLTPGALAWALYDEANARRADVWQRGA